MIPCFGRHSAKIDLYRIKNSTSTELNASLQQFGVFAKDLAIDEQMIPCFGRHSAKMFNRGKPIRFGYKNWVLASSDGYPSKFEAYTGACDTKDSSKSLGPQVVSALLSVVKNPACDCVYFDNFLHLIIYSEICTKFACIEMLIVAAWRLHVTVGTSPHLDFLNFIRLLVGGLLKTTSSASSGPNGRRIINITVGLHHPVNSETQGRCSNWKNIKNMVFACNLCAS